MVSSNTLASTLAAIAAVAWATACGSDSGDAGQSASGGSAGIDIATGGMPSTGGGETGGSSGSGAPPPVTGGSAGTGGASSGAGGWAGSETGGASPGGAAGSAGATGAGWESLFNGVDLTGWSVTAHPADVDKGYFRVEQGAIVADAYDRAHDYVWLLSDREYTDFRLRLQMGGDPGDYANSGVQIRSRYDYSDGDGWLNGPQIDLGFPHWPRNGSIWDETRGNQRWLYGGYDATACTLFYYSDEGPGWNDVEITALGTHITAVFNGVTITDYDGDGVLNDTIHRQLNVGETGPIALQIHQGDQMRIRYRDIWIQELGSP